MNSQYHIDTQKHADYPLPAGLHCQWVLADPVLKQSRYAKLSFVCRELVRPLFLYGRAEGGHLRVCWFLCFPVC